MSEVLAQGEWLEAADAKRPPFEDGKEEDDLHMILVIV